MEFLLELELSLDVGFAAETAELLAEEAETLRLDSGVDFVAEVEVREVHEGFEPSCEAFDEGESVVDENASIFQDQKVDNQPFKN